MRVIKWDNPKDQRKAFIELRRRFGVSVASVSLALKFKRNSMDAARMRYIAVSELGGKLLTSDETSEATKIISSDGTVHGIII